MKDFGDSKEVFTRVVGLQEEVRSVLDDYIDKKKIDISNYEEMLFKQYNEVAVHIFDELNSKSENMLYLLDHTENLVGDMQLISAFLRAYITDQMLAEIVNFEELEAIKGGYDV